MPTEREIEAAAGVISDDVVGMKWDRACRLAKAALEAAERVRGDGWALIETAPKDGTSILVILKSPIPHRRKDLRRWDGIPFIARHPGPHRDGFDVGWCFAAPIGQGGFPDNWIAGWRPLPAPPADQEEGK